VLSPFASTDTSVEARLSRLKMLVQRFRPLRVVGYFFGGMSRMESKSQIVGSRREVRALSVWRGRRCAWRSVGLYGTVTVNCKKSCKLAPRYTIA
jgi:hypothetical protein